MNYIEIESGKYPLTESQVKAMFPQVSFPKEFVPPAGYAPVQSAPFPQYDPMTQGYRELPPAEVGGAWQQIWEVYSLTDGEIEAKKAEALQVFLDRIVASTQARLDNFARTRGYDGVLSLCTYAASTVTKFSVEGQYGVQARDATWAKLYEILAEVEGGLRPVPSGFVEIEPELPQLIWPE